jgi:hypothetical protein
VGLLGERQRASLNKELWVAGWGCWATR